MKRKYSIGFFIGTIFILVIFVFAYRMSYSYALDKKQEESEKEREVQLQMEVNYYIKNVDGYVTVYRSDQKTVFEYTSILADELPEQIREKLKEGIKFTSASQVYAFLENYSS